MCLGEYLYRKLASFWKLGSLTFCSMELSLSAVTQTITSILKLPLISSSRKTSLTEGTKGWKNMQCPLHQLKTMLSHYKVQVQFSCPLIKIRAFGLPGLFFVWPCCLSESRHSIGPFKLVQNWEVLLSPQQRLYSVSRCLATPWLTNTGLSREPICGAP